MSVYIIRRLLLMIPTFLGILVINFAVLRLQAPSLMEQMGAGPAGGAKSGEGGGPKAQSATKNYENYLDRFRRAGNDLPALLNFRGFLDTDDVIAWLRRTVPPADGRDRAASRAEKELWLCGRFAVAPLAAILRDDALQDLHGPASLALSLCAYTSIDRAAAESIPVVEQGRIQNRNALLRENRIAYVVARGQGFTTTDTDADTKRARLLSVIDAPENAARFHPAPAERWLAIGVETGFVDIMSKLVTGRLESESRKNEYVFSLIGERWQISFWLNTIAIVLAWAVSIPLGIRSARRRGTFEDQTVTGGLFLLWSLPTMFIGTLMLHHLCTADSSGRAWFPNADLSSPGSFWFTTPDYLLDLAWHGVLPLLCLTYGSFTVLSRYMRGNLLEQLSTDYVRSARAKGCNDDRVVYRHAARNSMITMITLGSGLLASLFGGSVIVESIFSIQGLNLLLLDAAIQQDAPLLMASTVISVSLLLIGILVADLLYAVADPRIRMRYV